MAQNASDSQKVDYLWKKIVYGAAKTDISGNIDATNEPVASPLLIRGDKIWQQADLIANVIPGSNSSVVTVYPTTFPAECTSTAGIPTPTLTWQTGRTFWVPPEFGSTYQIKVYIAPSGNAANVVARKLSAAGTSLDPWQMRALTYACRSAKERFLGDANAETVPIVIHSRGSKLVGGAIRTELLADEVRRVILDGFFPDVPVSARPISRPRGGLAQPGLPYAQDTGVTRHLAAFLGRQVNATAEMPGFVPAPQADVSFIHPSAVLFNGGVFKPNVLVERTIATLDSWLAAEKAAAIRVLDATDLDKAVAQGAAYYGYVRRGQGMRIRGGTACAYYVAIESSMPPVPDGVKPPIHALCVAPFGMQEGKYLDLTSQHFGLLVGEPVYLRFFSSSVRRQDQFGALLYSWQPDELIELGQIDVTLSPECHAAGDVVEVRLRAGVTDSGTLELIAADIHDDDEWKVEFFVPAKPERSMLQYSVEIDFESGE